MNTSLALLGAVGGVVLTLCSATLAQACVPLPGPRWDLIPQEDGKGIAIARVVSVVPDGGDEFTDYVRAEVETLETLQGEVPKRFSIRGVGERRVDPSDITMWCGQLMTEKPGDVVMAVEFGQDDYRFLMGQQIAAAYADRMEAYRRSTQDNRQGPAFLNSF